MKRREALPGEGGKDCGDEGEGGAMRNGAGLNEKGMDRVRLGRVEQGDVRCAS